MNNRGKYQLRDLTGQKFGRLTVVERAEKSPEKKSRWLCKCDCGNTKITRQHDLVGGDIKSCGCIRREVCAKMNFKHGHTSGGSMSPEYMVWKGVLDRCKNPNHPAYARYGGSGISVSDEWMDFSNFLRDMGPRPSAYHTCDRIVSAEGYRLGNCRWATKAEQDENRKSTIKVTLNGKTQCLKAWCLQLGIRYPIILARVRIYGWSPEEALTTPIRTINRREHLYIDRLPDSTQPSISQGLD